VQALDPRQWEFFPNDRREVKARSIALKWTRNLEQVFKWDTVERNG
jgi:hypothetical protein